MKNLGPDVAYQIESNGVATLMLNRPDRHNAFDAKMIQAILDVLEELSGQPQVRILVLKSTGETFSAGADLNWMREMAQHTHDENEQDAKKLGLLMYKLSHFTKPTIAVVQGPAYGGGIGLIACCKIVIASTEARFRFSEVKLGLIPATIGPYIIQVMGPRQALAYFLSCKTFDANTALQMGLCHEIVGPDKLEETVNSWIEALLQGGPHALEEAVNFVNEFSNPLPTDVADKTAQIIARLRISPEGQEGLSAFIEKRKPNWIK